MLSQTIFFKFHHGTLGNDSVFWVYKPTWMMLYYCIDKKYHQIYMYHVPHVLIQIYWLEDFHSA